MAGSWWYTFVGNVLGYPGMSAAPYSSFRYESSLPWAPQPVLLRLKSIPGARSRGVS